MAIRTFTIIAALLAATTATAAPSPEASDYARKLVNIEMSDVQPKLDEINQEMMRRADAETDPQKREMMKKIFANGFMEEADLELIKQRVITLYEERFTVNELKDIYAFKQTAAYTKMKQIEKEIPQIFMPTVMEIMGRKFQQAGERLR